MTPRTNDIVRQIRAEIEAEERRNPRPAGATPERSLRGSEHLAAANRGVFIDPVGEIRSHRPVLGPAIVAAKRLLRRFVLSVLAPYLARERELFAGLVRFDNEVADVVDRLSLSFEERTRRLEREVEELRGAFDSRSGGGK